MNKTKRANRKEKKGNVWPVLISLLLAFGIFALLLNVEARKLAQYEKGSVVVAAMDVSEAKEITKENLTEYFTLGRSCDVAVSRILSTASKMVLSAVS